MPNYPLDAAAVLLVESDGTPEEVRRRDGGNPARADATPGATEIRVSKDEAERLLLWSGRKAAFPAVGRISPDYYCIDGTIPRKALPRVLRAIAAVVEGIWPAVRQRVPRRGRQPASADPVRRQQAGRVGARRSNSAIAYSSCASRLAAPSPASMASASRSWGRCACSSPRRNLSGFTPSRRRSMPVGCSIPARPFLRFIVAPKWVACTSTTARSRIPTCRVSRDHDELSYRSARATDGRRRHYHRGRVSTATSASDPTPASPSASSTVMAKGWPMPRCPMWWCSRIPTRKSPASCDCVTPRGCR